VQCGRRSPESSGARPAAFQVRQKLSPTLEAAPEKHVLAQRSTCVELLARPGPPIVKGSRPSSAGHLRILTPSSRYFATSHSFGAATRRLLRLPRRVRGQQGSHRTRDSAALRPEGRDIKEGRPVIVWASLEDPQSPDVIHQRIVRSDEFVAANSERGSTSSKSAGQSSLSYFRTGMRKFARKWLADGV